MQRIITIGTRGSRLALAQARGVRRGLEKRFPRALFETVIIKTTGDEFQSVELFKKNDTGVFTKAIERKLLSREIDIAVHSLKDLPTRTARGLTLAAFPRRLDTRDALISRGRFDLHSLPKGAAVGTGSLRRKRQILRVRPDLRLKDVRGNLDTRIAKVLEKRDLDAVIVARAGLLRLKKYLRYARPIPAEELLPAVGQAALGLEARKNDHAVLRMLKTLNDPRTERTVTAERQFLKTLRGGCRVPVGIHSRIQGMTLRLQAAVFSVKTDQVLEDELSGPAKDAERLGVRLARRLLQKGAGKLLAEARKS